MQRNLWVVNGICKGVLPWFLQWDWICHLQQQASVALWFPCYSHEQTQLFFRRVEELHLGKAGFWLANEAAPDWWYSAGEHTLMTKVNSRSPSHSYIHKLDNMQYAACVMRGIPADLDLQVLVVQLMLTRRCANQLPGSGLLILRPPETLEVHQL